MSQYSSQMAEAKTGQKPKGSRVYNKLSHQRVTQQKQAVLDGSARPAVALFEACNPGYDHFEPAGQGFDQVL